MHVNRMCLTGHVLCITLWKIGPHPRGRLQTGTSTSTMIFGIDNQGLWEGWRNATMDTVATWTVRTFQNQLSTDFGTTNKGFYRLRFPFDIVFWCCSRPLFLHVLPFVNGLTVGITTTVTPTVVCEQLKKMVKSSSPSLTDVSWQLGVRRILAAKILPMTKQNTWKLGGTNHAQPGRKLSS